MPLTAGQFGQVLGAMLATRATIVVAVAQSGPGQNICSTSLGQMISWGVPSAMIVGLAGCIMAIAGGTAAEPYSRSGSQHSSLSQMKGKGWKGIGQLMILIPVIAIAISFGVFPNAMSCIPLV
ncbi:hypothetical protein [Haladaptatus halobius]|uniref:hypothetical protein n=1 Tax=Haladaptatus halobius TaxID=2884875 RepID=UPI001D0B4A49|nr:hypothetical protein [Haladaptatus halobius]